MKLNDATNLSSVRSRSLESALRRRVRRSLCIASHLSDLVSLEVGCGFAGFVLSEYRRGLRRLVGTGDLSRFEHGIGRVSCDWKLCLRRCRAYVTQLHNAAIDLEPGRQASITEGASVALVALGDLERVLLVRRVPRRQKLSRDEQPLLVEVAR